MANLKYILMDEINLTTIKDKKGNTLIFDSKAEAREYGQKNINGWRTVEIPYSDITKQQRIWELLSNLNNDDYLILLFDYLSMGDYINKELEERIIRANEELLDDILRDFGEDDDENLILVGTCEYCGKVYASRNLEAGTIQCPGCEKPSNNFTSTKLIKVG